MLHGIAQRVTLRSNGMSSPDRCLRVTTLVAASAREPTREPAMTQTAQTSAASSKVAHRAPADRAAAGRLARGRAPLAWQAQLQTGGRPDPIALLEGQAASRVPELVPIRYGRMVASPFSFYRGGAAIMASDLLDAELRGSTCNCAATPHVELRLVATPERRLVFDVNDFDETLPGPFEWDVKRLAASLAVAGRETGSAPRSADDRARGRRRLPRGDGPGSCTTQWRPSGTRTWTWTR